MATVSGPRAARCRQVLRIGDAVFDPEPAAPGVAEQVYLSQSQGLSHRLNFLDIARDGPEFLVFRLVGRAAAELIVGHDPIAFIRQAEVRIAEVIARQTGAAVQKEQDLLALAVAVGHDLITVDLNARLLVWCSFLCHNASSQKCGHPCR
jgi:hypothetical protein